MNRPYIIYHMTLSMDGKINGSFLAAPACRPITDFYYQCHRQFKANGFLCGRVTMQESFTGTDLPDTTPWQGQSYPREDHVACRDAGFYAVALDPSGKLNWADSRIHDEDPGYDNAHVIEVLCESVSDAYLGFLRSKGISYLFAGQDAPDLTLAMTKLKDLFGMELLLMEGGGITGRGFALADLIDEVSFVMAPTMSPDGTSGLFGPEGEEVPQAPDYPHREVLPAAGGALWVRQWK
ncbi:MAG: pyrimidine reductase [Oscillospiraceae bacterium]|nr:pyrimidine reductase [Oscillospiraceae bacterium]